MNFLCALVVKQVQARAYVRTTYSEQCVCVITTLFSYHAIFSAWQSCCTNCRTSI